MREGIARALAVPEARAGWTTLLEQFRADDDTTGLGSKFGIGCALAAAADETVMGDVIDLVRERRHGQNRLALVDVLARSSDPRARAALEELSADRDMAAEVSRALTRRSRRRTD